MGCAARIQFSGFRSRMEDRTRGLLARRPRAGRRAPRVPRERHRLRASLQYNAHSTASHFFLAEVLLDEGRNDEARAELQQVIDAPLDPDWGPEDRDFKTKARALLRR